MRTIRLCEWPIAMKLAYQYDGCDLAEEVGRQLDEHAKVCPNHASCQPPKPQKRRKKAKR